ncbi:MAG: hypothetical protein HY238_18840 [Acidobacteria bacterium]|nr:hypothetical protein [Acidobacteriota bacterium]
MPPSRRWWKALFGVTLAVVAGGCLWRRYRRRGAPLVAEPARRWSLDVAPCVALTPTPSFPETRLLAPAAIVAFSPSPPRELHWELELRAVRVRREPVPTPEPAEAVMSYPASSTRHRLVRWTVRFADAVLYWLLQPFVNRRLRLAVLAVLVVLVLWSTHPNVEPAIAAVSRPLRERAAFTWQESFQRALRVSDLTLLDKTVAVQNYVVDFEARVEKKSIGWVVRSAGANDYTVFKLTERGRTVQGVKFDLVHYPVVGGRAPAPAQRETVHLVVQAPEDRFLNISVRVTEEQILTVVNGFGIDTWKRPANLSGGLGLLAENGESFLVKSLTITGNDDFLGLLLSGAGQALHRLAPLAPTSHRPQTTS